MVTQPSLTRATVSGLGWSGGTLVTTIGLQLIYTAVISRLLEPSEFGIMASALVGLRFVTYFSRFGLGSAIIQRPTLEAEDEATAIRLAVGLGCLAGMVTVAVSPLLERLVQVPDTAVVMRWMAIAVLLGTIGVIPEAVLRRRMSFRVLGAVQIASYVMGYLVVGVMGARAGWGVWSLVAANITQVTSMLVLNFAAARVRVGGRFVVASAKSMVRFGGVVSVTGFLEFISSALDTLAVGRYGGAAGVGQYSRATLIVALPVEQATTATSRVLMPSLSRVQSEPARFAPAVTTLMGLLSVVVMLPAAMIAAASPSLVRWLLGPGWEQAASLVPYVAVASGVALLTHTPAVAAEARGAVDRKLVIQSASLATTATLLAAVIALGPTVERIAMAWALGEVCRHIYYWFGMLPHLGLQRSEILLRYASSAGLAVLATAPVIIVVRIWQMEGFAPMALSSSMGLFFAAAGAMSPLGSQLRLDAQSVRSRLHGSA
jgi:lipopolysaccharide exporter